LALPTVGLPEYEEVLRKNLLWLLNNCTCTIKRGWGSRVRAEANVVDLADSSLEAKIFRLFDFSHWLKSTVSRGAIG
jgi:hypothetical protein